jgi:dUTP pyrophosphatase
MKIKVRLINPNCKFEFIDKGEWIDLRAAQTLTMWGPYANTLNGGRTKRSVEFDYQLIPLGFAMKLPKEFEATVNPRSGTFKNYNILMTNSQGVIDSSYSGTNDEWKFPAVALKDTTIIEGDRICQFRIQPSQKASVWTKIKWLFTNKIEFEYVDSLDEEDRGGFSSTGVN